MTAGTAERVYRLRDERVKPAMGAVLAYLAFRAYYEDGSCAWPSLDTIAAATFLSRRTVIRALEQLIVLGYVRENPNQAWNRMDPETGEWKRKGYRTVVYDVLTANFTRVEDESAERIADERPAEDEQAREHDASAETVGIKPIVEGCQNVTPETDGPRRGDIVTGQGCQNVTQPTNNQQLPPTPTGYPPASGESPAMMKAGDGSDAGTQDAFETDARRLCEHLAAVRRAASLTSPDATKRDLRAVARLLERLHAEGVIDSVARVRAVVDWAMGRGDASGVEYWRRRLRSGRHLARAWDELADDITLASSRPAARSALSVSSCVGGHREDCGHVRGVGESDEFVRRYPAFAVRHAHDRRLAELAAKGFSEDELREMLRGLLREDERSRRERLERKERETARIQQELAAERERRGGSMFVGARKAAVA